MPPVGGYILRATPRSGTTLLCGMLRQTGRAGHPESYFRAVSREAYCHDFGIDPQADASTVEFNRAYLDGALKAGRAGGAMFGLRLMQENLSDLSACLQAVHPDLPDDPARLRYELGRVAYIHVTRGDVVAQAVSLVKAKQTGLWHRGADGTDLEQIGAPQEPTYDFGALHCEVRAYNTYDAAWNAWFEAHNIRPHSVTYEALSTDPLGELHAILSVLGLKPHHTKRVMPTVSKLADAVSAEWAARYRADIA